MAPPQVLVVDDERASRLSLSEILRLDGCEVHMAASGEEALQTLANKQIDLMMLDIKMPGMDGMKVLAETRRISPQTVVIMLTAHGTLDTAMQAIEEQVFAYLLKPSAPEVILDKVRRGLARRMESADKEKLLVEIERNLKELRGQIALPPVASKPRVVSGGGILLDFTRHESTVSGKRLHLTPAEFKLLATMITHADEVISSQRLVREVQGYEVADREAREIIRPMISRLRSKLKSYPRSARCMVCVRGEGYMFTER